MKRPLSILVLTRFRPDRPLGGAALRNWQNICGLARLGTVDVVSIGPDRDNAAVDGVRRWVTFPAAELTACSTALERTWARLWPVRPGVHPLISAFRQRRVAAWLRDEFRRERYDVAVVEELSLAPYIRDLKRAGCCVVFDAHNVESVLRSEFDLARTGVAPSWSRRRKTALLKRRLFAEEQRAVRDAQIVWACSEHDARSLHEIYHRSQPIAVVPNGIDVDSYRVPGAPSVSDNWSELPITLSFLGSYSYFPNEDAALRLIRGVLPALRARGHRARVMLVGRDPTSAMVDSARGDPDIEITGPVESVLPWLQKPCIVTLPITFGSGTRLKILEAFGLGRPVVSTAKGAEGIDAVDGEHLLLRESIDEIVNAVINLWQRADLRTQLCDNALDLVRRKYSWSAASERIVDSVSLLSNRFV